MYRTLSAFSFFLCITVANSQSVADELKMKQGEMGGRGKEWHIDGIPPQNGVLLEITAVASPIESNVTNDLKPSPNWFLYFIVEMTNQRTGAVAFTKRYDFLPRGGIMRVADTVVFEGKPGTYRTTWRFDTHKIADNSLAQVVRIQEGTIRTSYAEITENAVPGAPGRAPKKRFRVD